MNLFDILNKTVSIPFLVISPDTLKINFIGNKTKKIINLPDKDDLKLQDLLGEELSEEDVKPENIVLGQVFYVANNISVRIENKYFIDKDNLFLSFSNLEEKAKNQFVKKEENFRKILLHLSTEFISVPVDNIDNNINNALKLLGEFSNVDRCFVFRFSDDLMFKSNIYEWCRKGIKPQIKKLQNISVMNYKYHASFLLAGKPLLINDVNKLPEEAAPEKKEFLSEEIKSVIVLPMMFKNKPIGFIGYDCCKSYRVWTNDDLYPLKIVGDIITSALLRVKTEKELKLSEERYRGFFENSGIGIFHTSLEGRLIRFNQAIIELFGFKTKEELMAEATPEQRFKNHLERAEIVEILKEKGSVRSFNVNMMKKGNIEFPARVTAKLIDDGIEPFIEGFLEDVTERKEFENALLEAKETAEKNDQLKSNFLAQVSHEIRTPINAILSFSQLIAEELVGKISPELEHSFSIMDSAGKRIIRTIDLILDMSQIQTNTFELIPKQFDVIEQVVKKLYKEYGYLADEKKLEFKMSVLAGVNKVNADIYTVEQILSNLIHNAIKYTDEGVVEIKASKINKNYIIEVIDTGIGISEEFLPNIFNTFTQESQGYTRKYEGNGLGLALVKKYCDMNKIDIEVESEKNNGSVFRLIFS